MDVKTIVGSVLGGLTLFLLGGTIYLGLMPGVISYRPSEPDNIVIIVVAEIVFGYLLTWVLGLTAAKNVAGGAKTGAILGLLFTLGNGLILLGEHGAAPILEYLIDAVVWGVRWAAAGAVVGWWLGRN